VPNAGNSSDVPTEFAADAQETESPQRQISVLELFAPHFYSIDISYNNRFAKYGIYGILLPTVGLPWDSPPPPPESVRTDVRTYADVTTKISGIDRLTNLLLYGAPLVRCARGLRYKVS